ncbi:SDR family NAD(P)-dependent oxidoreductase [Roseovarius nanhaiticus]|uniref:SDR family NAD(P)-dependent oxidoreductase n=1 Tax=Roseovarius nanhaiticus TaxID=573024 RepID=UPI00249191F0|nr:SDR family NAD(P)-dependent oxidoreductase [Roseovarius nanhaiticus]
MDKVALISGGSRGIGAEVAAKLADAGWRLSLGMRRPQDADARWAQHHVCAFDAMEANEAAWAEAALGHYGRIDAVICCAGIIELGDVISLGEAEQTAMMEVNVNSPRRLVRAAWQALGRSGEGRVIMLASLSGKRVASAASGAYSVSKFAAVALTHGIRQAGWDKGIRATAICPSYVNTDMAGAITDYPAQDMTQPEDVARMALLALNLPNTASIAEMAVSCKAEASY